MLLDQVLRAVGLTRRSLAREGVVSRDTVLRIERGLPVRRASLLRLATRLGLSLADLQAVLAALSTRSDP